MLVGPVFTREMVIAPRRKRLYVARTCYVAVLAVLAGTAWLVLTGTQSINDVGDLARFGTTLIQLLAPLQLALAMFFSAMLAASAVAQEKDRRTLVLLLLSNLSNSELVLGKLLASLLSVLVMLAAALPLFMLAALLGGVSFGQIGRVFGVTLASVLVCGSLGSTLALWREKTFQALAMTVLVLVLWLAAWEVVATGTFGESFAGLSCGDWAIAASPWQAVMEATQPYVQEDPALGPLGTPVHLFLVMASGASILLVGVAVVMVRRWNSAVETRIGKAAQQPAEQPAGETAERPTKIVIGRSRRVWDNPIIWREMRTWAYGRKIMVVRLIYLLLFGLAAGSLYHTIAGGALPSGQQPAATSVAMALIPLMLLSLVLVNAQAVTSMTSERDGRALDLLLVTDLTPKEIVFGKLGGVFYNAKEMVVLPMLLCIYLHVAGWLGLENLLYLLGGLAVLFVFVAMLGVHAGMTYGNSQAAIITSLGTVFFLFVGVAVCMRMMMAFSGSFQAQLPLFLAFMLGGAGLYVALGVRNPSTAIGIASFLCPLATFYAITGYMLDYTLAVFLVTFAAYGFTTAAMLVPAIYEFDVATGRTTIHEE